MKELSGVAGVRDEDFVAGVDEGERDVEDALFRADEGLYLAGRVELHAVPSPVELRHCLTEFGNAYGGLIAVCRGLACFLAERLDGLRRWWHVGASDGEADDVFPLCVHSSHLLELAAEVVLFHVGQPVCRPDAKCFVFRFHRHQVV